MTEMNKFKQAVLVLEEDWETVKRAKENRGENALLSISRLVLGVITAVFTLLWTIHIVFGILITINGVPLLGFLNVLLEAIEDSGVQVMATLVFAALNFHLLACVVKGCFKFGMRVFCLFPIHPMRVGDTPLNSFLFNLVLILFGTCAVVMFSHEAFRDFSRLTAADVIFGAQTRYLDFFRVFYQNNVFLYTFLVWAVVTLIYLLCKPRDESAMLPSPSSGGVKAKG
mmetsp:Transcript_68096/g.181182  ORF Transcript_68096/g.181182 Transcript_68096/m.181182 type:complete len:227 (-) Transcript_68096:83-763(-)